MRIEMFEFMSMEMPCPSSPSRAGLFIFMFISIVIVVSIRCPACVPNHCVVLPLLSSTVTSSFIGVCVAADFSTVMLVSTAIFAHGWPACCSQPSKVFSIENFIVPSIGAGISRLRFQVSPTASGLSGKTLTSTILRIESSLKSWPNISATPGAPPAGRDSFSFASSSFTPLISLTRPLGSILIWNLASSSGSSISVNCLSSAARACAGAVESKWIWTGPLSTSMRIAS